VAALAAAGYRLAIVSNVPMPGVGYRWALARLGIEQHFEDLRFSHDEGSRKPSPVMLERVLEHLGVAPSLAVMVGDRRREDVGSGRALGCATVWLESRYDDGPAADATIADLAALPALLATWSDDGPQG
jgi:putative hydrolase of the HAD superfamily